MTYAMSDLHGESGRYQAMLERIRFSPEDALFILGDVVDRGGIGGIDILRDVMAQCPPALGQPRRNLPQGQPYQGRQGDGPLAAERRADHAGYL